MKPVPSVLVLSGLLVAGAGTSVSQEQQNPLQIFKDALKSAKDALKTALPPKTGAPPAAPPATPAPTQAAAPRAAQAGTAGNRAGGAPGEPAAGAYESLVTSDAPSALPGRGLEKAPPDIGGVRLGMSPEEVHAVLSKRYPGRKIDVTKYDLYISTAVGPPVGEVLESFSMGLNELVPPDDRIRVVFTPPPGKPVVWSVTRNLDHQKIYQANALASLREKYGRESLTGKQDGTADPATNDSEVRTMIWVYDRQGHSGAALPGGAAQTLYVCSSLSDGQSMFTFDRVVPPGESEDETAAKRLAISPWCSSSGIIVWAEFNGAEQIVGGLIVHAADIPTVESAMRAEAHWLRKLAAARAQQQIDASKQSKPDL